jgi:hypothetical protein
MPVPFLAFPLSRSGDKGGMDNEKRERTTMDEGGAPGSEDEIVRGEEERAGADARDIGGPGPPNEGDEASRPVEEGGGGEAEGFEQAERELEEQASHGENRWDPETDAFTPEEDEPSTVYGEPDEVDPTEVTRDPLEGPDDPGAGPGIAPER